MADPVSTVAQPSEETLNLVSEGMAEAHRLARCYVSLARRLDRLGELSSFFPFLTSWAALFTILSPVPRWAPLTLLALTIAATLFSARLKFHHHASLSFELGRQLGRLSIDWKLLAANRHQLDDAELRSRWRQLFERQRAILDDAPLDLALSLRLMRRCRLEAEQYRSPRHEGVTNEHPTR